MSAITWSFFYLQTGLLTGRTYSAPDLETIEANTPLGCGAVTGAHDHKRFRVDLENGAIVEYQPPSPGFGYEWDGETRAWVRTAAALKGEAARGRIKYLEGRQARAVRELAINPANAIARETLTSIDSEIEGERQKMKEAAV